MNDDEDMIRNAILHDIITKPFRIPDKSSTIKVRVGSKRPDRDASLMSRYFYDGKDTDKLDWSLRYRKQLYSNLGEKLTPKRGEERIILDSIEKNYGFGKYENDIAPTKLYERLIEDDIISKFNESPISYLQYTSLKYHTILVTNLTYNYIKGYSFEDLYLSVVPLNHGECFERLMVIGKSELIISGNKINNGTKIGYPMCNFGQCLRRMKDRIEIEDDVWNNAMRIKSWSVGLQYINDAIREVV